MNIIRNISLSKWFVLAAALILGVTGTTQAQTVMDGIEVLRATIKADRKVVIAENLQLTDAEGKAFWPMYRDYRHDVERANDGQVNPERVRNGIHEILKSFPPPSKSP